MHPQSDDLRKLADDLDRLSEGGIILDDVEVKLWPSKPDRFETLKDFAIFLKRHFGGSIEGYPGFARLKSSPTVSVYFSDGVCEPVVVGKRIVPAHVVPGIPDREVPEKEEDIVEYRCGEEGTQDKLDAWDLAGAQAEDRPVKTPDDDIPF